MPTSNTIRGIEPSSLDGITLFHALTAINSEIPSQEELVGCILKITKAKTLKDYIAAVEVVTEMEIKNKEYLTRLGYSSWTYSGNILLEEYNKDCAKAFFQRDQVLPPH